MTFTVASAEPIRVAPVPFPRSAGPPRPISGLELSATCTPQYSNTMNPSAFYYPAGASREVLDDLHLVGTGFPCAMDVSYFKATPGPVDVTISFYANTALDVAPGSPIAGPFHFPGLPSGDQTLRFGLPASSLPPNVWMGVQFSADSAGLVLADPPVVGTSHDRFYQRPEGMFFTFGGNPKANFALAVHANQSGLMPGDLNCDGLINIADLAKLNTWLWSCGTAPCDVRNADVNGDCEENVVDFLAFLHGFAFGSYAPYCSQLGPSVDPGIRDTIAIGSILSGTGQITVPIYLFNDENVHLVNLPLRMANHHIARVDSFSTLGTILEGTEAIGQAVYCGDSSAALFTLIPSVPIPPTTTIRNIGYVHMTITGTVAGYATLDSALLSPGHKLLCGLDGDIAMVPEYRQEERNSCRTMTEPPFTNAITAQGKVIKFNARCAWTRTPGLPPYCAYDHCFPERDAEGHRKASAYCLKVGGSWESLAELVGQAVVNLPSMTDFANVECTYIGSYTMPCKNDVLKKEISASIDAQLDGSQVVAALGMECNIGIDFGVQLSTTKKVEGEASTYLKATVEASPFRTLDLTLPNADIPVEQGQLKVTNGTNKLVVKGNLKNRTDTELDIKNIECGTPYPIRVKINSTATKTGAAFGQLCVNGLEFVILSMDDPPEAAIINEPLRLESVRYNGINLPLEQVNPSTSSDDEATISGNAPPLGTSLLALPAGFAGDFYPFPDSTYGFPAAALALGEQADSGRVVFASVKQPVVHGLPDTTSALIGFSRVYKLENGTLSALSTDRLLLRLPGIAYDPVSDLMYAAERDTVVDPFGATVAESTGTLLTISTTGHVDTVVWNPPTLGRLFRDPLTRGIYIAAPEDGKVFLRDSVGTISTLLSNVSVPIGLARTHAGPFSGDLAVAEVVLRDTALTQDNLPFKGRILLAHEAGGQNRFDIVLDRLVTDCAFGPGSSFGSNLYVAISDSGARDGPPVRGSGKLMTMDTAGTLTPFANGLEDPRSLLFDPNGILYVGVPGGIVRIRPGATTDARDSRSPGVLVLYQVAPNPARSALTLGFDVPRGAHVGLRIHDVAGREVKRLLSDHPYAAGKYAERFDISDLPAGVYFLRLTARYVNGVSENSRKLIVVR